MPGGRCAVYGCNNSRIVTKKNGKPIIYHAFPRGKDAFSETILKNWIISCHRGDKFNPTNCAVCSVHFTKKDYVRDLQNELLGLPLRKLLKKTAVPSLNLPQQAENVDTTASIQKKPKTKRKEVVERQLKETSPQNELSDLSTLPETGPQPALPESEPQPTPLESKSQPTMPESGPQPTACTSDSTSSRSLETVEKKYYELLKSYNQLETKYSDLKKLSQNKMNNLNAQTKKISEPSLRSSKRKRCS